MSPMIRLVLSAVVLLSSFRRAPVSGTLISNSLSRPSTEKNLQQLGGQPAGW